MRNLSLIIDIFIDEVFQSVAASFELEHKSGIAQKYRVSDKMLSKYGSIVDSVVATISSFPELRVTNIHQSKKSYTVYITVISDNTSIDVIFRLHDHSRRNSVVDKNTPGEFKSKTIVKDIRMNGEAVNDLMGLIDVIYDICMGLSEGDIHSLLEVDYNE